MALTSRGGAGNLTEIWPRLCAECWRATDAQGDSLAQIFFRCTVLKCDAEVAGTTCTGTAERVANRRAGAAATTTFMGLINAEVFSVRTRVSRLVSCGDSLARKRSAGIHDGDDGIRSRPHLAPDRTRVRSPEDDLSHCPLLSLTLVVV